MWQQNAAAWVERLGRQYPLYRDVAQPVQLAVQELRYGLALMAGASAVAPHQPAARLAPVLARLMAFPRAAAASAGAGTEAAPLQLDSPEVQQAVADAAAAAAEARGSGAAPSGGIDAAEQAKRAAYAAAMAARLQLLRCTLAATARDVEAARLGAGGATAAASAAALAEAQGRLHGIFMGERRRCLGVVGLATGRVVIFFQVALLHFTYVSLTLPSHHHHPAAAEFVGAWEEVKAEEARRAEAEAEVFKHKTRSTDIASEEQVGRAEGRAQPGARARLGRTAGQWGGHPTRQRLPCCQPG